MKIIHYSTKPTEDSKFLQEVRTSDLVTYSVKDQIFVVKSRYTGSQNTFLSKEGYKKLIATYVERIFQPVEEIIKSEKII